MELIQKERKTIEELKMFIHEKKKQTMEVQVNFDCEKEKIDWINTKPYKLIIKSIYSYLQDARDILRNNLIGKEKRLEKLKERLTKLVRETVYNT